MDELAARLGLNSCTIIEKIGWFLVCSHAILTLVAARLANDDPGLQGMFCFASRAHASKKWLFTQNFYTFCHSGMDFWMICLDQTDVKQ